MEAKTQHPVSKFDFIDRIRFVSMMAIVMEHSTVFWGLAYPTLQQQIVQTISIQFFKFGTIIFFLLSGFLIGDKFHVYSSKEYFLRRLNNTFKPWLFWVFFQIALNYLDLYVRHVKFGDTTIMQPPLTLFFSQLLNVSLYTSYWFIINFMICIGILLMFRKFIDSMKFGAALAVLSLFYSVNLYCKWIPTEHTLAFFGFVFYLWLGYQINKHYVVFTVWVQKTSNALLAILYLITFTLSCAETVYLMHLGSNDPFNTLKVTDIFYSFVCFIILFKFSRFLKVQQFKPRIVTFGIYLIHQNVVFFLLPLIFQPLGIRYDINTPVSTMVVLQFTRFAIAYVTAYLMTWAISYAPKKYLWIIGQ